MDKNTFLAIILSVVVISLGFVIQTTYFMPEEYVTTVSENTAKQTGEEVEQTNNQAVVLESTEEALDTVEFELGDENYISRTIEVETDKFIVTFNTEGAIIESLKLREHMKGLHPVDMIQTGDTDLGSFGISLGDNTDAYLKEAYDYKHSSGTDEYSFIRNYKVKLVNGSFSDPFQIKKTFVFFPDEYMFEVRVELVNSENSAIPLNYNGMAYTLFAGPQIGPEFQKLDGRNEFRKYYSLSGDKREVHKLKNGSDESADQIKWAAIVGKYFTMIGIPGSGTSNIIWSNTPRDGLAETSEMIFERAATKRSNIKDVYRFYIGPKNDSNLAKYNMA
ncbi:membrane protein insertase YidC, partial [Oceanispirochaeta sp.]|uniref:membrane protein insertase YidC n=1 Tax=Oceanispirochaeta sp. TaxID=2035350 RepID=UPI0026036AB2